MAEKKRIGWIGTGVMGASMAGHLLAAGYQLTVYNRTKSRADGLVAAGATWADSPKAVAQASDIVFTMVGYPSDVEQTILGTNGVLEGLGKGCIVCDMTTSSPDLAKKVAEAVAAKGSQALDAPVTGGDVGAREARLSIFVGGDKTAWETIEPLLLKMGQRLMHCGGPGTGQQAKLANQVAVGGIMFSVCESLLFAQEAGLDVPAWLELVSVGAAGSAAMNTLGRRLLKEDYDPGFFVEHFVKDLGLCLEECRRMQLVLPGLELADEFYRMIQAQGKGRMGTQCLMQCLAEMSGKKWRKHV